MPRGTCWRGFEQKGFKKKGKRSVPNCVRVGAVSGGLAKQAATAIAMKKVGKKPKKLLEGGSVDMTKDQSYFAGLL